jgi:hypothetical protein
VNHPIGRILTLHRIGLALIVEYQLRRKDRLTRRFAVVNRNALNELDITYPLLDVPTSANQQHVAVSHCGLDSPEVALLGKESGGTGDKLKVGNELVLSPNNAYHLAAGVVNNKPVTNQFLTQKLK